MTEPATPAHRVNAAITAADATLAEVAQAPVWSMTAQQVTRALDDLQAHEARCAALRSRLITHAGSVDAGEGMRMPAWLAQRHRLTRPEAHRRVRLAEGLGSHPLTAAALERGEVSPEQAAAILRGVRDLPTDLAPDLGSRAEEHLLGLAASHDAKALGFLARTILEVVDPDAADAHLARLLARSEAEVEDANRLHVWQTPAGRVRGTFDVDGFTGACLTKALSALAAPRHRAAQGRPATAADGGRLPTAERLGQAFAEYVRRYPRSRLPRAGGLNASVVVLMDYKTLVGDIKAARLDTGEHISAGLARRIAVEAGIRPAVLGGESEVLDLGRARRFHSGAQRIVATIEQGGCLEEGCTEPPAFTQMHHPVAWSRGGTTDRDGWMLCLPAHLRIHDPRYSYQRLPSGKIRFHRRT